MPSVEAEVLKRSEAIITAVMERDTLQLVTDSTPGRYAGIVSFRHHQCSSQSLYEDLFKKGVFCACRGDAIRFSPHSYTPLDKIYTAVALAAGANP